MEVKLEWLEEAPTRKSSVPIKSKKGPPPLPREEPEEQPFGVADHRVARPDRQLRLPALGDAARYRPEALRGQFGSIPVAEGHQSAPVHQFAFLAGGAGRPIRPQHEDFRIPSS